MHAHTHTHIMNTGTRRVGRWRAVSKNSFAYTSFVEENKKTRSGGGDKKEEKEEEEEKENPWKDAVDPMGNIRAAKLRDERLQSLGLVKPSMKVVKKDAERMIDLDKRKESWICTICTVKNEGTTMRCVGCKAKRVREDPNCAREMCTFEFLMCSGGGFSYDLRNCREHYKGAVEMATLRWNEVMQDVKREKHPLSPRSQQMCRSTHPEDGSTISADQEFKLYGVTDRELSSEEDTKKNKKRKTKKNSPQKMNVVVEEKSEVLFENHSCTSSSDDDDNNDVDDSIQHFQNDHHEYHEAYHEAYHHHHHHHEVGHYDEQQQYHHEADHYDEHHYEVDHYDQEGGYETKRHFDATTGHYNEEGGEVVGGHNKNMDVEGEYWV